MNVCIDKYLVKRYKLFEDTIMATLLLVVIYTAYIGLGIPDSLFGAAGPAI